jgi:hypothetical protein
VSRIVDAWMQHPSRAFLAEPMFESLCRWSHGGLPTEDIPLERTIEAMDEAGVRVGLLCAWWGPRGPLGCSFRSCCASSVTNSSSLPIEVQVELTPMLPRRVLHSPFLLPAISSQSNSSSIR